MPCTEGGNLALDFLAANKQISMSSLQCWPFSDGLDRQILPILESSFTNLKSLSLVYHDPRNFPESPLAAISRICGLEELHLSVGLRSEMRWRIDHEAMRKHLKSLKFLRKLAFSRDTYPSKEHPEISADDRMFNNYEIRLPLPAG